MSLIVRYEGQILLMTKGADSVMIPRTETTSVEKQEMLARMTADLLSFAKQGLRTLVVAQRTMSDAEYKEYDNSIHIIKTSLAKNKEEQLSTLWDNLEQDLTYVGSTAIEDKLQYGVPETLDTLLKAQIKLWILTGDK